MEKDRCRQFFHALVFQNDLGIDTSELMRRVAATAASARNHILIGPGNRTGLSEDDFPGEATANITTVDGWFDADSRRIALSQYSGDDIYIRGNFDGYREDYQFGIMLHELLHKRSTMGMIGHDPLIRALDAVGAPAVFGQANRESSRLGQICGR